MKDKFRKRLDICMAVNILTLVCMLLAMGTGTYLSQSIFSSLWGMREAYLVRSAHVAAAAWGTILVSVHGGMHIKWAGRGRFFPLLLLWWLLDWEVYHLWCWICQPG